jgi:hypothetical protein
MIHASIYSASYLFDLFYVSLCVHLVYVLCVHLVYVLCVHLVYVLCVHLVYVLCPSSLCRVSIYSINWKGISISQMPHHTQYF